MAAHASSTSCALPDLPPDLDGFTVVQLSDLHAGSRPSFNLRAVRKAVDETRRIAPDLIVITGDLVTGGSRLDELLRRAAPPAADARRLRRARQPRPRRDEAGQGAGDRPLRARRVRRAAAQRRVRLAAGRGGHPAGLRRRRRGERLRRRRPVLAALDRRPGTLRLLLSHYGEVAERLAPGDFALVLSGDTHGGQICLPAPGVEGRAHHVQPAAGPVSRGLLRRGRPLVYVSRGVGTSFLPFRLLCRPEIVVFRLRRAAASAGAGRRAAGRCAESRSGAAPARGAPSPSADSRGSGRRPCDRRRRRGQEPRSATRSSAPASAAERRRPGRVTHVGGSDYTSRWSGPATRPGRRCATATARPSPHRRAPRPGASVLERAAWLGHARGARAPDGTEPPALTRGRCGRSAAGPQAVAGSAA